MTRELPGRGAVDPVPPDPARPDPPPDPTLGGICRTVACWSEYLGPELEPEEPVFLADDGGGGGAGSSPLLVLLLLFVTVMEDPYDEAPDF